jgi:2'-5' RNA ligase
MQKFTQKWTFITLLEPVAEGTEFFWKNWPLHVTLADVFAVDWENTNLLEKLTMLLASRKPIQTVAGDDTYFGPTQDPVRVTILSKTAELQSLHNDIISLLKGAHAVFNTPQYVGEGYLPHCTVQKRARLHKGDAVQIDSLTIVDMFPGGDGYQRKLFKTVKFSG